MFIQTAPAQIQQAWVARYNNGLLNGTNQAVKIALDSNGNIYVSGFSQNTNANLGYITLKYSPAGTQLWSARHDVTNYPSATPSGFGLDNSNNAVVTGNAQTIKYDANGNQLWTAPYAGDAIAVDPGGNAVVTGMGASFSTVKLSPAGSNLWLTTYADTIGPASSQVTLVDNSNNVYVAGSYTYVCYSTGCYESLKIVKYDGAGNQLWASGYIPYGPVGTVLLESAALDGMSNIHIVADFDGNPGYVLTFSNEGSLEWATFLNQGNAPAYGLAVDSNSHTVVTGSKGYKFTGTESYAYGTFKLDTNGNPMWTNYFPEPPTGSSVATGIALDSANNSYVTGYSSGTNGTNNIVTIKYDPNGNQIWLQRYSSPGGGNAAGNAIAVDSNGNVYVTGYDTTAQGGTEIVTIKYSPVPLQLLTNGTVLFQAQGAPGESFDIEASEDLLHWFDLGTVQADTNGLLQFDDTNAPNYPSRFYHTTPQ